MPGIYIVPGSDPGDFNPVTGERNIGRFGVGAQGGGSNPGKGGIVFSRYVNGVDMWAGGPSPAQQQSDASGIAAGYVRDPNAYGGWRYAGAPECEMKLSTNSRGNTEWRVENQPYTREDALVAAAKCNQRVSAKKAGRGKGKGCCCCCCKRQDDFVYSVPTQPPVVFKNPPTGDANSPDWYGYRR